MSHLKKSAEYYRIVARVIEYIDSVFPEEPDLIELASVAALSEYHFHRIFSEWVGLPPKRYLQFLRKEYAQHVLATSRSLLEAADELKLSSAARLHDLFITTSAVTPGQWRSSGHGLKIRYTVADSPFNKMLIAKTERGICDLQFFDEKDVQSIRQAFLLKWKSAALVEDATLAVDVEPIFSENRSRINLHLFGTNFQIRVWEALLKIPEGDLISYEQLAERAGDKNSVRATASAVGKNPLAYLIPCHRVIRKTGVLNAYRWGEIRKKAMIAYEAARCCEEK